MKIYIFLIAIVINCNFAYSQKKCATKNKPLNQSKVVKGKMAQPNVTDPNLSAMRAIANNFNPTSGTVMIPVVVHVVYNSTLGNLSEAQICSQIEVLNEDFARRNADRNQTPAQFLGVAS